MVRNSLIVSTSRCFSSLATGPDYLEFCSPIFTLLLVLFTYGHALAADPVSPSAGSMLCELEWGSKGPESGTNALEFRHPMTALEVSSFMLSTAYHLALLGKHFVNGKNQYKYVIIFIKRSCKWPCCKYRLLLINWSSLAHYNLKLPVEIKERGL